MDEAYRMSSSRSFSSARLIRVVEQAGWKESRISGSHHIFKHPDRPGTLAIPHPKKDLPKGTALSILKQAGIDPKDL